MKNLLVATRNVGKLREISALLAGVVDAVSTLEDYPDLPHVEEDEATFEGNACKKARAAAVATGLPVIADDSGLLVDALGGRPGVFSARFAGEEASDADNNEKLLREMKDVPPPMRTARFRCVVALCYPDGNCHTFGGELEGKIITGCRGGGGFGYDPLFLVPEYGLTLAELPVDTKNRISHRGKAFCFLREYLDRYMRSL